MKTYDIKAPTETDSYSGLFIRDNVGETVSAAGTGGWTNSPDIICAGVEPITDPSTITSATNYAAGLPGGNSQVPGEVNFVYVRGKNVSAPETSSTVYLYYAPQSLGLLPNGWKTSGIQWNSADGNAANVDDGSNGNILVTTPSFLWTPPTAHEHYCLVAWARNGTDQATPPTLPTISTWGDLGNFIIGHKDVAWRNLQELTADTNVFRQTVPIDNPPQGGEVSVGLEFDNVPADGTWQFTIPMETGPAYQQSGTVEELSKQPYFVAFPVTLPADWTTSMTFSYTPPEGVLIPQDASIEPLVIAGITDPSVDVLRTHAPQRLVQLAGVSPELDKENIQHGMVVGSIRFKLKPDS